MKQLFLISLIFVTTFSFSQNGVSQEDWEKVENQDFEALISTLDINFSIPANFSEKPVVENEHVLYQKAYAHDSSGFEMRILIQDIRKKPALNGVSDDEFSKSNMKTTTMNASGLLINETPRIMVYSKSASEEEYQADWVASTAFIPVENSFNKDFEVCSIIGIRKNDFAQVFVFFMMSNYDEEAYLMNDLIQVLTFKKEIAEGNETR